MIKRVLIFCGSLALAAGITLSAAPSAQAAPVTSVPNGCHGAMITRCIDIKITGGPNGNKIATNAKIYVGSDYPKRYGAMQDMKLQRKTGEGWRTVANSRDYDGWHTSEDTPGFYPGSTKCGTYRGMATFKWKQEGSSKVSTQTLAGNPVRWC